MYSGLSPDFGYSGDEDQGLMGSLAVLMKIGIFSVNGGTATEPVYEIASPLFEKVTIHLNRKYYPGEKIIIESRNNSSENYYVRSAAWNGVQWDKSWITHDAFVKGGTLTLDMASAPNKQWASAPASAPPSMSTMEGAD